MSSARDFCFKFLTVFLFQFLICIDNVESSVKYDAIPKKVECKKHSDLVTNFTCSYKKTGWKKAKYNFDGTLQPNVEASDLLVKSTLYRRGTNLEYRVFGPKDYAINVCSFLNGTWTHVLAKWAFDYLKEVSRETNILHPCPFSGHLYVHDLIFDENSYTIVDIVPDGEYKFRALVYTKHEEKEHLLAEVTTETLVKSKGIFEF